MTNSPSSPIDYLQARTAQCYRSGCIRRLQHKDDVVCYLCAFAEKNPNYKDEYEVAKNKPSNTWYFLWTFPTSLWEGKTESLVCKCCEGRIAADSDIGEYKKGVFKSFIGQCPLTRTCKAAMWHWGKDSEEPLAALKLFKAQRASAIETAKDASAFPAPINVHLAQAEADSEIEDLEKRLTEGHFEDNDFIDLQQPRLRRSKNAPKK